MGDVDSGRVPQTQWPGAVVLPMEEEVRWYGCLGGEASKRARARKL